MIVRALVALCIGATLVGTGASVAATPEAALAKLNAQRVKNGIPGGITLVPSWSKACALHNRYLKRNEATGHDESPSKPGYTKNGAWAGKSAVLAFGVDWDGGNPWENAPIHLAQLLAPQLRRIGVDDSDGYVCATTWPGYAQPSAKATLYSYPGDGTRGWSPRQTARERPFVPGDAVGLPQGTETGLHLYVFSDGQWLRGAGPRLQRAQVVGPGGPVELRTVERRTRKVGQFLPRGAVILIPVKPLRAHSRYTAEVTLKAGTVQLTRKWTFFTGAIANELVITRWRWEIRDRATVEVAFRSSAPGAVVTLETEAGEVLARSEPVTTGSSATLELAASALRPGTAYRLCAQSGGEGTSYVSRRACVTLKI